jgi:hypothetical protein
MADGTQPLPVSERPAAGLTQPGLTPLIRVGATTAALQTRHEASGVEQRAAVSLVWRVAKIVGFTYVAAVGLLYVYGFIKGGDFPYDEALHVVGRDFLNVWTMGREAWSAGPAKFYNEAAYNAYLRDLLRPDYPEHAWSYPPLLFLYAAPFGLLGYFPALAAWIAVTYAFFLRISLGSRWTAERFVLIGLCPAAFVNLLTGQNGFLVAGLFIGALRCLDSRPRLAGVLIGLLAFKPQLGLLIPLALLVSRRWQVISWAAGTVLAALAASVLLFGVEPWLAYCENSIGRQVEIMRTIEGFSEALMATPFMNARLAGLSADAAMMAQLPFTALSVGAVAWTFWRRRDPLVSAAVLAVATFLVSPYQAVYDMGVLAVLAVAIKEKAGSVADAAIGAALWLMPAAALMLGLAGLPGSALILAGVLLYLCLSGAGAPARAPQ